LDKTVDSYETVLKDAATEIGSKSVLEG